MALGLLAPIDEDALTSRYAELATTDGRVFLVAEVDGEVRGMGQLVLDSTENGRHRAEIQRVAVSSSTRGTGVGRALMGALEDAARDHDITIVWLTTHEDSDAADFYEALGYTKVGVIPNYAQRPDGKLAANSFYYRELR
jgi:ribosomal protein S18 acetylase RimI-like enzyme